MGPKEEHLSLEGQKFPRLIVMMPELQWVRKFWGLTKMLLCFVLVVLHIHIQPSDRN